MTRVKKGDMVRVKWQDIVTELSADELSDTILAVHVGVVEKQSGKTLWIKNGWYENEADWPSKDGIAIPKGCIDTIEKLKVDE